MDGMTKEEELEFLQEAKERFDEIETFEGPARELMENDLEFQYRDQWKEGARKKRDGENRPCITIRRTNQFTDHIKNEQRQNKPQIKVSPIDDGAQEVFARRRQGLIRHIQYDSRADQAFQRAYDFAVDCGRGWFKVTTEYLSGKSFEQKVVIEPIKDQFSIYMDPRHEMPDYSDCKYGFQVSKVKRKEFEKAYPEADPCSWSHDDTSNSWIEKDDITLAEYYCIKTRKREVWEIEVDGIRAVVFKDEIDDPEKSRKFLKRSRTIDDPYVMWYYISPKEILAEKELLCKWIPLVPIIGKETIINGKLDIKGIVRDLIDPAQMYNFWASQEAELVSLAPKTPYIGAKGQFEGYEHIWGTANDTNYAYLEYAPVSHDGHLAPPPQRQQHAGVPVGVVNAKREIVEDMKAITGMYDASVGARSNETSGVAIRERENQGNNANFHFPDNYAIGLTHAGKIINEMIPHYYSEDRTVTIMGEDDEEEQIGPSQANNKEPAGFGDGDYAVVVSVGPSFNSKREEAAMHMIDMAKNVPLIGEGAADLIVKSQDWPMKDEIAERAKRLLEMKFQGLTAPMEDSGEGQEVAALTEQLQQMSQQMEQLAAERQQMVEQLEKVDMEKNANEAHKIKLDIAKLDIDKQKMDIEAQKLELEARKVEVEVAKADLEAETKIQIERMKLDTGLVQSMRAESVKDQNDAKAVATKDKDNG